MATLAEVLESRTAEAAPELIEHISKERIRCYACGHECPIPEGAAGVCKVRFVRDGVLHVPWGYVGGVQCDPIEKKPFFHAHPGALAYSVGMLGCDLHCAYCQNWVTSQALRDPSAVSMPADATPPALAADAVRLGARVVVSTYNEPLITAEWGVAIFKEARAAGLMTGFVSNGNGTPRVLDFIRPWIDLYKVDLKSFDDKHYRQLGGRLEPILFTIRRLYEMGVWLEIVTLLIPGFNNSPDEVKRLTAFIASVSADSLARDGVSQGLPDERSGEHDARDADGGGGDREGGGPSLRLHGEPPGTGGRPGEHPLPPVCGDVDRAVWVSGAQIPRHGRGNLPGLRHRHSRPLGPAVRRPDRVHPIPARHPPAANVLTPIPEPRSPIPDPRLRPRELTGGRATSYTRVTYQSRINR
jgi:pyruvate formate lyase activating enzyme